MSIWKATAAWSSVAGHVVDGVTLEEDDAERVLQHLANLWGYEVHLVETNDQGDLATKHHAEPIHPFV